MKPFYFGSSRRPLFGVHHPPRGPGRRTAALVCSPFGQESLRAHRSLRELASGLAEEGFPVLRFDYSSSGDSAGDCSEATIEAWLDDVATAADELREASECARLAVVGLRLGATLASCVAGREDVAALVLWDPIPEGRSYLAELRASHAAWLADHAPGAESGEEVLGFPLPAGLAAGLETLRMPADPPVCPTLVVSSRDGGEGPTPWPEAAPERIERRGFPPAPVWLNAEGMERALVPGALIAFVTRWLATVCR